MSSTYEGSYFGTGRLDKQSCSKCNINVTTTLTEPDTDNLLCTNCFDKEYSKKALRDKKLEQLLQPNKKWWQFW